MKSILVGLGLILVVAAFWNTGASSSTPLRSTNQALDFSAIKVVVKNKITTVAAMAKGNGTKTSRENSISGRTEEIKPMHKITDNLSNFLYNGPDR